MSTLLHATSRCLLGGRSRSRLAETRGHEASFLARAFLALGVAIGSAWSSAGAQQPASTPATPLAPYRPPTAALVEPATGVALPQDRPTVVFRFAPGDSTDPIDARSLSVFVDGKDRTSLFQLARDEAWGQLAPAQDLGSLAPGAHTVAARICSIRGACGEVAASVTVSAAAGAAPIPAAAAKRTLMELLLEALKKLLAS